ncbi:MAG: hypothetical protein GX490_05480 [Bacilli bacterium]|nr:hypothetical protein [Bacilli bacterium]
MINVVCQFFSRLSTQNKNIDNLERLFKDDCLLLSSNQTLIGKVNVTKYFKEMVHKNRIERVSLLNSIKGDKSTLLVNYCIIYADQPSPVYGAAIFKINRKKIDYINYRHTTQIIN